ncbi:MAG: ABC-F family ATP-binding cassette domain-containing protein, partial [Treponema socranskii subsp. buccale]
LLQQAALITKLEESGWHRRRAQMEGVLTGLGFLRTDFERRTEEFSGGWQMRIALAKSLMQNPDILLLDEPTNYLDIEARTWLERFLQSFKGGFLLVSHDRYFLDVSVTEVYELFGGELKRYPGNFTHYEAVRKTELKTLIASYEQQQKEIRHLEEFIRRFGAKATKASQAQERQKQLDKIQRIEIPESMKKIRFTFPPAPHAGKVVLRINGVTKSYDGEHNVLDKLDVTIENGDRLVVAGHNGAGKSTLLRIIAGEDTSFSGELVFGSGVRTGYFSQDSSEEISGSESIIDYIESVAPLEMIPKVRDMLGAFLFRGDDVFKSLDVLSGGEKNRIALLKLLLEPVNFLVLDEPTNHLDMHSKDVLMQALKDFGGTVVFVSHDRGFIEGLSTRVLALEAGRYRIFPGDYAYYLERIEAEKNGRVAGMPFSSSVDGKAQSVSRAVGSGMSEKLSGTNDALAGGQLSWEKAKKRKAEQRKLEREVERLEAEIAALEAQKAECENELAKPEVYASGEKSRVVQKRLADTEARLTALGKEWEAAAESAERAKAQS